MLNCQRNALINVMLLGRGNAGYGIGGASDWTVTSTRKGEMCGQMLRGGWNTQVSGGCIDMHLIDMLPSQIIEHFGHLSICFGVAAREQQAHCGYLWIGVARHWLDWQQKAGTAPRAFCLRGAGAAQLEGHSWCWWGECQRMEAGRVETQHWW